ncbi:MAG TPA: ABC transporter ATP-binding protein [Tissierellaceae bacterium]
MAENVRKNATKYSLIENIRYLIKNMWIWDKKLFAFYLLQIPLLVLGPLLTIYIPKVLIDCIQNGVGLGEFIRNIGMPILGLIIVQTIRVGSEFKISIGGFVYRIKYFGQLGEKSVDTDYENIDGASGQDRLMKAAMSVANDNSGTQAITTVSIQLLSNIIGMILYGSIIFTIHPLFIVLIILTSLINYFLGNYANKFEHRSKNNLAPVKKKLEYIRTKAGDFKASKDLRLYNMVSWFKDMYQIFIKERINLERKNISKRYLVNCVDGLLAFLRDGLAYGYLIYSVLFKNMDIGDFVLYFGAIGGFSAWISGIVNNFIELNRIHLETSDLRDYLEMEDKMNRGKGVELPKEWELPCDIELKNVYYKYPGAEDYTLKNINLHIKKGEKLAIVGVNGAGKTTLVKLICGLYTPTKGEIYINGKKSSEYNRDEYYSMFSVVFQDFYLLPVSIAENIALRMKDEIDDEKLDMVLNMSGLMDKVKSLEKGKDTLLVKSVFNDAVDLSGGEMQKLVLARALYKDAPIVILDEPTSALDPIAENELYQKYNEFTKDKTSIFISHRLASTKFCDRIVLIDNGEIVEIGDHKTLMDQNGKYRKMYDMQSHYYKDKIGGEEIA